MRKQHIPAALLALASAVALILATDTLQPDGDLVGYGCGPDRVTMYADFEDEFPVSGCERIEVAK